MGQYHRVPRFSCLPGAVRSISLTVSRWVFPPSSLVQQGITAAWGTQHHWPGCRRSRIGEAAWARSGPPSRQTSTTPLPWPIHGSISSAPMRWIRWCARNGRRCRPGLAPPLSGWRFSGRRPWRICCPPFAWRGSGAPSGSIVTKVNTGSICRNSRTPNPGCMRSNHPPSSSPSTRTIYVPASRSELRPPTPMPH